MIERYVRRDGFFAIFEDIGPPGDGFVLFSNFHFVVLILASLFITTACIYYKKSDAKKRRQSLVSITLVIFVTEVFKQLTFLFIHGQYWPFLLPFHLCGMANFFIIIHTIRPNKTTAELLYSLFLPGAVSALTFSGWADYPIVNYYFIHSKIFHTLQVSFILMQIIGGDLRPNIKHIWRPALFLAITVPFIYHFNINYDTNFFFVNAGLEGSPLEFFITIAGVPWFLIPYALLVMLVWVFMYLPWLFADRR